jgi:hypothetical protein
MPGFAMRTRAMLARRMGAVLRRNAGRVARMRGDRAVLAREGLVVRATVMVERLSSHGEEEKPGQENGCKTV